MPAFKDQLDTDFEDVFANADEFGGEISWDGDTIQGSFEDMGTRADPAMGVNLRERIVFILARDIDVPEVGQEINMNAERWYVKEVLNEEGCLEITLQQEVS